MQAARCVVAHTFLTLSLCNKTGAMCANGAEGKSVGMCVNGSVCAKINGSGGLL